MKQYDFQERFRRMSNLDLIWAFNLEVGNQGWGTARATYLVNLYEELKSRKIDLSEIETDGGFSLRNKIILEGTKALRLTKKNGGR